MATITVRGLDDEVRAALKRRARRHGHSMEEEARQILTEQVAVDLAFPNALVEFHAAMRDEPVELELPERTHEPPRVSF